MFGKTEFSIVDCMFVVHEMDNLNKQFKFNISCENDYDKPKLKI